MPDTYIQRQLSLKTSADSYYKKLHFRNEDEVTVYSSMDHTVDGRRDIAASGAITVDLAGMTTAKMIYVESDGSLEVTLDTETITITPIDTGGIALFYAEGAFTSMTLTNPSSSASLEVLWLLAGN